jgi:phosphonate transport system ATP-binding protein
VVFDGPSRELTPALLRNLYGMQADEILNGSASLHEVPSPAASPAPAPNVVAWPTPLAQAA